MGRLSGLHSGTNSRVVSKINNFASKANKPFTNIYNKLEKENENYKFYTYTIKDICATLNISDWVIQFFIDDNCNRLEHWCIRGSNLEVYNLDDLRKAYQEQKKQGKTLHNGRNAVVLSKQLKIYFNSKFLTYYKKELLEYAKQNRGYLG